MISDISAPAVSSSLPLTDLTSAQVTATGSHWFSRWPDGKITRSAR
ncbi:hypothetical protein C790_03504 [Morganella morganii SC01]|nr:hypothetical protein C790_03504 [Morganella morganii SC01]